MNLSLEELKHKLQQPLPGIKSQLKMAPMQRAEQISGMETMLPFAKNSAVLILLFHDSGDLKTIVIKRSEYEGVHSGQIAFPGGKKESEDKSFENTALRETFEEVGVEPGKIEIIGQLSDLYIPPSNFLVKVFVGYSTQKLNYVLDAKEVQSVIELNIDEFYDKNNISEEEFGSSSVGLRLNAPFYNINNLKIWGATAMIISELLDVLKD